MSQTEDEEMEETRGEEEIQLITLFVSVCVCITHKGMESYIYIYMPTANLLTSILNMSTPGLDLHDGT